MLDLNYAFMGGYKNGVKVKRDQYLRRTALMLTRVALFVAVSVFPGSGQEYPESEGHICFPHVELSKSGFAPHVFCLGSFTPPEDSCTDIEITFPDKGVRIQFHCNEEHLWSFSGTHYDEQQGAFFPVHVITSSDESGALQHVVIRVDNSQDSGSMELNQLVAGDREREPDTIPSLDYQISQRIYRCNRIKVTVFEKEYTFSPGYMRRDQRLNHPELSMFHCGGGISMPTSASVSELGIMINEYKILHPPKIQYDDPEEIYKKDAHRNKLLNKRKKKGQGQVKEEKPRKVLFKPL